MARRLATSRESTSALANNVHDQSVPASSRSASAVPMLAEALRSPSSTEVKIRVGGE